MNLLFFPRSFATYFLLYFLLLCPAHTRLASYTKHPLWSFLSRGRHIRFPRQCEALASSDCRQQFIRTGVDPNACKPMVLRQRFGIGHFLPAKIRLPLLLDTYIHIPNADADVD